MDYRSLMKGSKRFRDYLMCISDSQVEDIYRGRGYVPDFKQEAGTTNADVNKNEILNIPQNQVDNP